MKYLSTLALVTFLCVLTSSAQMRKIYSNTDQTSNDLCKLSFYSPSQGYVAFSSWIGFTADSGRTFAKKPITLSNVNYNGYSVNLTFGFSIMGVKSFDQNNLLVYGDYGAIPAILYSVDGGNTFKLVFHSQINPLKVSLTNGVADMDFSPNTNTGFAVDEDRILKTTDKGLTWSIISTSLNSYYNYVQALDASNVFAGATYYDAASKLQKTVNGGSSWQAVTLPAPTSNAKLTAVYFLNASAGWILMVDNGTGYFYKTTDGGSSWILLNNIKANPFPASKIKFIDNNIGFAVDAQNTVYKTSNGGAVWEPLPRDNNLTYSGFSTNDIQLMGSNQIWAGWASLKMLELSTNAGGTPLAKSYLYLDTTGLGATGNVSLTNYSATGYSYKWFLNGVQISTAYNSSYVHDPNRRKDTVALVVSNGINNDTATSYAYFNSPILPAPPPSIASFSPSSGSTGSQISITGNNLYVNSTIPTVTIGGVPVSTVYVYSNTFIVVIVGPGASGNIKVTTPGGIVNIGTFTYISPPIINSFSPVSGTLGDIVTINGLNFTGATTVKFGDTAVLSFTVVSDTQIKATIWLGASGAVKVTRPSGTGQANGFIFIPPPAPAINILSSFSGTPGTSIKIFGTHFYGTTSVKFGDAEATSFVVVSDNEIDAVVGFSISGSVVVTTLFGSGSIGGFTILQPPIINSFTPKSGSIGTDITISGANFSPVASENIVYFGSVKGTVTVASHTQITVQVPYGANFQPVSVTVKNLTAYTLQPFLVTSIGDVRTLTDSSYNSKKDFPSQGYYKGNVAVADFDGDGKPDLVNNMGTGTNISVLRNICSPGTISFAVPIDLTTPYFPVHITPGDFDGDGKLDLVVAGQQVVIFKNTSNSIGQISFGNAINIKGAAGENMVVSDLNGDGKPDIVFANVANKTVDIFGNISTPDSIAFAAPISISFGNNDLSGGLAIGDLDNDGKLDIAVVLRYAGLVVLRNSGTNGNFSFTPSPAFILGPAAGSGSLPTTVAIGDLDGDGKSDLAVGLSYNNAFTILRNTSTGGSLSFDVHLDFTPGNNFTNSIAMEDLDGDGKPDLALAIPDKNVVMVYKNSSTVGKISFNSTFQYGTTPDPISTATADLDLDGKADIFTNNNAYVFAVTVLQNKSTVLPLPAISDSNYKILVMNNTCQNKNEGKIIVILAQDLGYNINITGAGFSDSSHFTGKSYERDNLPAGIYQLCFTIDNLPAYQQCFTVNITQPKDLALYSKIASTGRLLEVTLGGSSVYDINFNGASFQTSASNITLPLLGGINTLSVQTSLNCQGIITRTFFVPTDSTGIKLVPNPVVTIATLYLPGSDTKVQIEVVGLDGKIVDGPRNYTVSADRSVKLNMSHYTNGLYLVRLKGATLNRAIKFIKTY